jgi:hypothetical protein
VDRRRRQAPRLTDPITCNDLERSDIDGVPMDVDWKP